MRPDVFAFAAPLLAWRTEEYGDIGFVHIDGDLAEAIGAHEIARRLELGKRRGFGSVKVAVQVGETHWSTSVFPRKEGGWFLPIRKAVSRAEGLETGDLVEISLRFL